jgi:lactate permease
MTTLLAALPILLILVLMVGLRRSAALSALVGLAVAVAIALTAFAPAAGAAALLGGVAAEALFTALTILWIIFPALALYELQSGTGAVGVLRDALMGLSADPRFLAILIAWFFGLFMEGAAGFGTPAALAAPMLVAVGFSPLRAVTLALVGHTIGVSFGAVGTPVLPQIAVTPFNGLELARPAGLMHALLGGIVMAFLVHYAVERDGEAVAVRPEPAICAWGALAAAAVLIPYALIAGFVGPELPTLGAALLGGFAFVWALRRWGARAESAAIPGNPGPRRLLWAALPYLVLVTLILATRLVPEWKAALRGVELAWSLPGGFAGSVQPLYHPGTMLLAGFLIGGLLQGAGTGTLAAAAGRALKRLPTVVLALIAMLALARLMVHSGMIDALAEAAANALGGVWPALAPLVGVLGSFVTGSATSSNILFSDFQQATAAALGLPALPLLGAQNFGAAVGNIICPHNIIAACAVVGLAGREGEVLRRTLLPAAVYSLSGAALSWVLVRWVW